ncbi:MAG: ABC transporter permease [Acutalibacteraceae bacterium]|nr:ABC transporter permease [Acutalibacteraceae bacterium]
MVAFIVSAIRLGMTLLFGSTGETITEKSGHLNLGLPGVMCVGASCGCFAEYLYLKNFVGGGENPVLAVIIPMVATFIGGALMGLIFSFLTVTLRANQNVTGLALTTLGVGISDYMIDKTGSEYIRGALYFKAHLPIADKLGWFGRVFLSHGILVYLAIIVAIVTTLILNKTRLGLHLRAVGENPATADAAGINVVRYRYGATCIGCGIAGFGGLSFIMDYLNGNWEYVIDDIGWLAVALVIFTVWKPNLAIFGSLVFGALYIASSYITGVSFAGKELFKMLPYIVTIVVLIFTSMRSRKKNQPPESLGLNYFREER